MPPVEVRAPIRAGGAAWGDPYTPGLAILTPLPARRSVRAMDYRDRITIDPAVRFGKPIVRGTRITVGDVLSYLAGGMSEDEIIADFPQLARDDIRACLAFAADRERRLASVPAS